jgi:hypothetical protein
MKRTDTRTTTLVIGSLFAGWLLGASGIASSQADEVTPAPVVQGEIIKVCINLKSGAIRAASKCDSKTERKTVIGGVGARGAVGPQGEKGETGAQGIQGVKGDTGSQGIQGAQGAQGERGIQGLQGLTGQTGAAGSLTGLRTKEISVMSQNTFSSTCNDSPFYGVSLLNSRTTISGSTLSKNCTNFSITSEKVYVP